MNDLEKFGITYIGGLDIGQAQDPTALVVIERFLVLSGRHYRNGGLEYLPFYHLRHIERFQLGSPFAAYEGLTRTLFSRPPLAGKATLVIDHTGVGARVVESLQAKLRGATVGVVPVNITARAKESYDAGVYNVPKRDLVGVIQVLLGMGGLRIAEELPLALLLVKELQNFRIKYTPKGNDTYEAWREGDHDDLVLATALACWWGENHEAKSPLPPGPQPVQIRMIG